MSEITVKTCSKCKVVQLTSEFSRDKSKKDGVAPSCKLCERKHYLANRDAKINKTRQYYQENKECVLDKKKDFYQKNKPNIQDRKQKKYQENKAEYAIQRRKYYLENRESLLLKKSIYHQKNKDKILEKKAIYYKENKDYIGKYKIRYVSRRKKSDSLFSFRCKVRSLISDSFRRKGYSKKSRTHEILGCSFEELKAHLESTFSEGMSWEVKDKLHIDHIIPLASAKTEEDVIQLNHYTNLQMLWAIDNIKKGAKMPHELV